MTGWHLFGTAVIFMFLIATRIGDDVLAPVAEQFVDVPKVQVDPPVRPKSRDAGGLVNKNSHIPQNVVPIDKSAFLTSFKRQSHDKLLPCLANWRSAPNSVLLSGRLYYGGELRNIQILDEQTTIPDCVSEAILEMNFRTIAEILKKNSWQSIQWQIDW